jgi:hypothetical protein
MIHLFPVQIKSNNAQIGLVGAVFFGEYKADTRYLI